MRKRLVLQDTRRQERTLKFRGLKGGDVRLPVVFYLSPSSSSWAKGRWARNTWARGGYQRICFHVMRIRYHTLFVQKNLAKDTLPAMLIQLAFHACFRLCPFTRNTSTRDRPHTCPLTLFVQRQQLSLVPRIALEPFDPLQL